MLPIQVKKNIMQEFDCLNKYKKYTGSKKINFRRVVGFKKNYKLSKYSLFTINKTKSTRITSINPGF
jgi:hypothetical protein